MNWKSLTALARMKRLTGDHSSFLLIYVFFDISNQFDLIMWLSCDKTIFLSWVHLFLFHCRNV